jgi:two-component system phosphate regulon sensor histidine kinase PhoR
MTRLRVRIVAAAFATTVAALVVFVAAFDRSTAGTSEVAEWASAALVGPMLLALLAMAVLAVPLAILAVRPLEQSVNRIALGAQAIARGVEPPAAEPSWDEELMPLSAALRETAATTQAQIAALETEHARLAAILAHMGDGVVMIDSEGRIGLINAAASRLLGTSAAEAEGHSLVDVARDHELVAAARHALAGGETELPLLLEMGLPRRVVQVVATSVPPEGPGQPRALLLLQDVTELRHAETVRREFVANVSHELRTPVASLKALAETLEQGALEDPPAARLFLTRMLLETDRLAQLIEELLELALLESGAAKLHHEPLEIAEILPRAAERLSAYADRHGVKLIVDECPEAATVVGDALRLERVIVNLVDNAVKFTAPGGEVRLRCEPRGEEVIIAVSDTGTGISPENVPRIFERFYKADRARASSGTGLGLAIAKHTIEAHQGRIRVESQQGRGSTFFISLPRASGNGAAAPPLTYAQRSQR